jgi:hypothetical protein
VSTPCGCGCGKTITNQFQACFPVLPWDQPDAPRRTPEARCATHSHCAYRDDDPNRCSICHGSANCTCNPPWTERSTTA